MKVTVVCESNGSDFADRIETLSNKGWVLYGHVFKSIHSTFNILMYKYGVPPNPVESP